MSHVLGKITMGMKKIPKELLIHFPSTLIRVGSQRPKQCRKTPVTLLDRAKPDF